MADNDHLRGLSREDFVPALAKLHGELNQIHAFPEGNGRTQRLFLEQLAERAGHRVDLSIGTQHRIIEASIAQTNGVHGMMERFIAEAADPQRVKAMRDALDHLSQVKDREFVASVYIAATVPGEKYKGVLYGQNGRNFIMRTEDSKLIVGHAVDLPRGAQSAQAIELTATDGHKASISPDLPGGKGLSFSNS